MIAKVTAAHRRIVAGMRIAKLSTSAEGLVMWVSGCASNWDWQHDLDDIARGLAVAEERGFQAGLLRGLGVPKIAKPSESGTPPHDHALTLKPRDE